MDTELNAAGGRRRKKPGTISALRFGIKWPNDIVVSAEGGPYRKICGILTEMRLEEMEIRDIVIGIGLKCQSDGVSGGDP